VNQWQATIQIPPLNPHPNIQRRKTPPMEFEDEDHVLVSRAMGVG